MAVGWPQHSDGPSSSAPSGGHAGLRWHHLREGGERGATPQGTQSAEIMVELPNQAGRPRVPQGAAGGARNQGVQAVTRRSPRLVGTRVGNLRPSLARVSEESCFVLFDKDLYEYE